MIRLATYILFGALYVASQNLFSQTISAGNNHNLAIDKEGQIWGWGDNIHKQLGNAGWSRGFYPAKIVLPNQAKSTAVAAGRWHSLAVDTNGKLYGWGRNDSGQTGIPLIADRLVGLPTLVAIQNSAKIISVSAGYFHSLALDTEGRVYEWGFLPRDDSVEYTDSAHLNYSPKRVLLPQNIKVVKISAGAYHNMALDSNGIIYVWGSNRYGAYGNDTTNDSFTPNTFYHSPILSIGIKATAVSAGEDFCAAIGSDGYLYLWGKSQSLAFYSDQSKNTKLPAKIITSTNVALTNVSSGGGGGYVMLEDKSSKLFAYGYSEDGALGVGSINQVKTFTQVNLPQDVSEVSTGRSHVLAKLSNGEMWAWGANYRGQMTGAFSDESKINLPTNIRLEATRPSNYSDMWWAGAAENGWGMSIQQSASDVQFNVLYVYDQNGLPVWYVMPGGEWSQNFTRYTGLIYQPKGSPLDNYRADQFIAGAAVGSMTIDFQSHVQASIKFTINGTTGSKTISRQNFGVADSEVNVLPGGMWWGGPAQNGWGINVAMQSSQAFAVWYSYRKDGSTVWYVVPNWLPNYSMAAPMYSTISSSWLTGIYNPTELRITQVGTITMDFGRSDNQFNRDVGSVAYSFTSGQYAGTNDTKMLLRQKY